MILVFSIIVNNVLFRFLCICLLSLCGFYLTDSLQWVNVYSPNWIKHRSWNFPRTFFFLTKVSRCRRLFQNRLPLLLEFSFLGNFTRSFDVFNVTLPKYPVCRPSSKSLSVFKSFLLGVECVILYLRFLFLLTFIDSNGSKGFFLNILNK